MILVFRDLDCLSSIRGTKSMAQKTKIGRKCYPQRLTLSILHPRP